MLRLHDLQNVTELAPSKSPGPGELDAREPNLGKLPTGAHMNVRRFSPIG
jgi:hypothetical protein